MRRTLVSLFIVAVALAACERKASPPAASAAPPGPALPTGTQSLVFRISNGAMQGPDAAVVGWAQLRQEGDSATRHNVVAFILPRGVAPAAFAAALDTMVATPSGAEALGGSESAASNSIVALDSGRVFIACLSRDKAGKRHAARGEWHVINVSGGPAPAPASSVAKIDVAMGDFAYLTADRWPAGAQLIQVRNTGRQDHLMLIARLHPGATMADFAASTGDGAEVVDPSIGISRMGPGRTAYLPITLEAGHYVLFCLITDPASKRQHVELGMMREIEVDPGAAR